MKHEFMFEFIPARSRHLEIPRTIIGIKSTVRVVDLCLGRGRKVKIQIELE
jgi:hypothetical protein